VIWIIARLQYPGSEDADEKNQCMMIAWLHLYDGVKQDCAAEESCRQDKELADAGVRAA